MNEMEQGKYLAVEKIEEMIESIKQAKKIVFIDYFLMFTYGAIKMSFELGILTPDEVAHYKEIAKRAADTANRKQGNYFQSEKV